MSKLLQNADSEGHDDVAGLFQRLGNRDENRAYRDFSDARSAPVATPAAEPLPPPVPVPSPMTTATVAQDNHTPAPAAAVTTAGNVTPTPGITPLQQLFQRLAAVPTAAPGNSPLSRLRER